MDSIQFCNFGIYLKQLKSNYIGKYDSSIKVRELINQYHKSLPVAIHTIVLLLHLQLYQ